LDLYDFSPENKTFSIKISFMGLELKHKKVWLFNAIQEATEEIG
jgi:hypothetical protein